jgi:hypothetical protein
MATLRFWRSQPKTLIQLSKNPDMVVSGRQKTPVLRQAFGCKAHSVKDLKTFFKNTKRGD